MPKPPSFTPEAPEELLATLKKSVLEAYASNGTVREACDATGVPSTTVYGWRMRDPDFGKEWDLITREHIVPMLEQAAIERARDKSDLLLMFLLKAYRRDLYDDRRAEDPEEEKKRKISIVFAERAVDKATDGV